MTRTELDRELERLMRETERRRGLGGYSADAPGIYDIYRTLCQLTLHMIQIERQLAQKTKRKK